MDSDSETSSADQLLTTNLRTRAIKYWVLSVIIFVVSIVFEIGLGFLLLQDIIHGSFLTANIFGVCFNLFGIVLLGNGLFGSKYRTTSLSIYVWIFQVLAIAMFSLIFLILCFYFNTMKGEVEQKWELKNGTAVIIFMMILSLLGILYTSVATWIIFRFKTIIDEEEHDMLL